MRQVYTQKSNEEKLLRSKPDVKQIFGFIFSEGERFYIFWRAWKVCARIKDDHQYSRSITAFITDLERANSKHKYSIRRELY
ncbi:MAG: hypothetical protein WAZ77_20165, partial [Candidatus Nitrosopolaris sp.]